MLADAYGTHYATLAALVGVALTAAKTLGPVAAGVTRTTTGSYTAVLGVAAVAALAAAAVALAGRGRLAGGQT